MARFFFDFSDESGQSIDSEGTELANDGEVQLEASRTLAEIARDRLPGSIGVSLSLKVRDEVGRHVLSASVVFRIDRAQ